MNSINKRRAEALIGNTFCFVEGLGLRKNKSAEEHLACKVLVSGICAAYNAFSEITGDQNLKKVISTSIEEYPITNAQELDIELFTSKSVARIMLTKDMLKQLYNSVSNLDDDAAFHLINDDNGATLSLIQCSQSGDKVVHEQPSFLITKNQ